MGNKKPRGDDITGLLVSLLILASFVKGSAQSQHQSPPDNTPKTDSAVIYCPLDLLTIEVKIKDSNVREGSSLGREDFIIYEDGVEREIRLWARIEDSRTGNREWVYAMAYSPVYLFDGKSHKIRVVARSKDTRRLRVQFSPKGYNAKGEPLK